MYPPPNKAAIEAWLGNNGWFPDRDIGDRANELIAIRVEDAKRQGYPLGKLGPAERFLRSFGDLTLPYALSPSEKRTDALITKPTFGYEGDAEDISELAENLGSRLFPVGSETDDYPLWLIDESGRFFFWHHTGGYFLGDNEWEAFSQRLGGGLLRDAEDFFV